MVTDPIADMLTRIRNAQMARHRRVDMPVSKLKVMAFSFSAAIGSLGGALFAAQQSSVFPTNFTANILILIYACLVLGGAGAYSYLNLGRAEDPSFTIKSMVVNVAWPGATAVVVNCRRGMRLRCGHAAEERLLRLDRRASRRPRVRIPSAD